MRSVLLAFAFFLIQVPQQQSSASVEGIVVQLGTGTTIPGARVNVGGATTVTDSGGRFAFRNLQPGRYRVFAAHPEYVSIPSGTRNAPASEVELTVRPGQATTDIFLAMVPKGAISGHVYDRSGEAVKDAAIQALKYAYQDGRRILVQVTNTSTNQAGEYRLLRLAPGSYVVRAVSSAASVADSLLPVYFPGTIDASAASAVEVPAGVDFSGVDLKLGESRAARVRGQVVDGANGQPASGGSITLVPRRGNVATGSSQRAAVSNMGTFEFTDIAPGPYDLVTTVIGASGRLSASAPVDVSSSDVEDIHLILQPQLSIAGRISVENFQAGLPPVDLRGIRVELRREPYTTELLILIPAVAADGSFTLTDVTPGDYRLKVTAGASKGYVKYARFGNINALNPPFHVAGAGELDIVLGLSSGSVDAFILDEMRKSAAAATAVLVPDPPYRHRLDLYYSSGSDASGRAHFESLAPGDYRIFAWDEVPADAWQDIDFIRSYEDRGKLIHIGEGSGQVVELQLISRP
jgi:uncharacterized surface anchored protein